ncbi:sugar phosphate permease [Legionella oakridgensis RV-2-2007]|nr:MFS transporter [Legionella oakridgensis]ETO92442.1 sugar phosphate permease [Legionella oakridgensis RV-2-2007]
MLSDSVTVDSRVVFPRGDWMAWLVCLSAGLFFFYEFFQLNLFDVINAPLREEFQIDAAQLSWMSSTYLWADILFLLPAGIILDRFSTRQVILTAMFVCVIGTVGFALTNAFAVASFFHFLSGIGNAFCFLSCVVLVSRWFPPRRQALVIGCLVTMAFIGGMMAHTPLAYLNAHYGWRNALLLDGGVGVLLFIWIFLVVKDWPCEQVQHPRNQVKMPSNFLQALTNRQNWLAGLYTSCLNLPIMVLCALWGASYLEVVHQLPKMDASNVVSLIFIGSILGCPLVGWLSDSMGQRKPLMVVGAIAALLTVMPLFAGIALSKMALSVLFFVLGVVTSTQVITYPLIAESNRSSNTGAATGIASVIIMGGGGVGQVLFGLLMHHHAGMAHYTVADFQFAMWMFPIAIIVALLAVLFTQETYCKSYS